MRTSLIPIDDRPTTLYRFFDADGALLYVGITWDTELRWQQHAQEKAWWPEVACTTVTVHPNRHDAAVAEMLAIRSESPRHNVDSATRPRLRARRSLPSGPAVPVRPLLSDLIGPREVARVLGLSGPTSVNAYWTATKQDGTPRYPDFPLPVLPHHGDPGKKFYWWRPDIERWRAKHPPNRVSRARINRRAADPNVTPAG